jgi:hypothetical protein
MERESSGYRWMGFSGGFVRPGTERTPVLDFLSSPPAQGGLQARKIFVLRQERGLDSRTGQGKTIRSILIFDDHPSSLRLVLAPIANPQADHPAQATTRWWEPLLGGMLLIGTVVAILLPLFLKLSW